MALCKDNRVSVTEFFKWIWQFLGFWQPFCEDFYSRNCFDEKVSSSYCEVERCGWEVEKTLQGDVTGNVEDGRFK